MARILVTDGEERSALATVRALGRAGHTVFVCSSLRRPLAGASRYCEASASVPDAADGGGEYVAAVRGLIGRWRVDIALPMTDASLLALLPERDRLGGARVPFPDVSRFRAISDKARVLEAAARLGIRIPSQRILRERADLTRMAGEDIAFPAVLKPTRSTVGENGRRSKPPVQQIRDSADLADALGRLSDEAFPLLLQQRIEGPGIGVFLLMWEGRPVTSFCHRRIREKPPSGGVSVYRESTAPPPALLERSVALLRAFEWQGVAMVEYKVETATGQPYLMEINGRFWGSLQLALDAGIDFPNLLVRLACGQVPEVPSTYEIGVRSRWWWGDVDHLLARLRRSRAALALPAGEPGRLRVLLDFLRAHGPGSRSEVLRFGDPLPALVETIAWLRRR